MRQRAVSETGIKEYRSARVAALFGTTSGFIWLGTGILLLPQNPPMGFIYYFTGIGIAYWGACIGESHGVGASEYERFTEYLKRRIHLG